MPPRPEELDQLIEWHPGPPEAARASVLGALWWGLSRAWNSKLLIFWLWVVHLVVLRPGRLVELLPFSSGIAAWDLPIRASVGGPLWNAQPGWPGVLLSGLETSLWSAQAIFFLLYGLLAGGAISYLHARRPAPFWAQFGAGCGVYFGRFLRLVAVGGAVFGLLLWIDARADSLLGENGGWFLQALLPLLALLFAMTLDFARVRTVVTDSRSMIIETWRSLKFVFRNLPRTLGLQIALTVIGVALWSGLPPLARVLGADPRAAFVIGEIYFVLRIWLRLASWAAFMSLYQGIATERLSSRPR